MIQTAYIFNCKECGEVWDVIDTSVTTELSYNCRQCGNKVEQVIENGKEKLHFLTEEEKENISLRDEDCSGWEYYYP